MTKLLDSFSEVIGKTCSRIETYCWDANIAIHFTDGTCLVLTSDGGRSIEISPTDAHFHTVINYYDSDEKKEEIRRDARVALGIED